MSSFDVFAANKTEFCKENFESLEITERLGTGSATSY